MPHQPSQDDGVADEPLQVIGLSVAYGARLALEGVSFSVPAGSIVGVIGPNGAGKSTLFKAILGAVPRREGVVLTAGRPAYVPQGDEARLDLPVTALDVALMGRYREVPWWRPLGRLDRERARAALAEVGAGDLAGRAIGELSGGQRQRVYLARALVQGGGTMLLDEPLAGVDAVSQEAILSVLHERRAGGAAILLATHDLDQAARICDRLLFLNRSVIAFGPPELTLRPDVLAATLGGGRPAGAGTARPLDLLDPA
jgi:ABC-type Mn2+/Zn2+ transport system ATPase subunit